MVDFIGAARDPQFRQDVGQGLVDAFGRGLSMVGGAPVDLTTMFLRPLGYSVPDEQIVGSSEYIGRQMANLGLISETRNPAAEFLSALLIPDPTDIQKLAPYVQRAMNADLVAARPSTPGAAMRAQRGSVGVEPTKQPWQMTKKEYNTQGPLLEREVFRVKTGDRKKVDVIRNPSDGELQNLIKETRQEYGLSPSDVSLRHTMDAQGNKYYWPAPESIHAWIEPELGKMLGGVKLDQNQPKESHRRLVFDALKRGEEVPPEVLKDYPEFSGKEAEKYGLPQRQTNASPPRPQAPREEALRIAQENAAKPVSEGGLGLPPDNTAMDRARAMGFDTPTYRGTSAEEVYARPGTYSSGNIDYANRFATGENANIMPLLIRRGEEYLPANKSVIEGIGYSPEMQKEVSDIGAETVSWVNPNRIDRGASGWGDDASQFYSMNPSNIRSRFAAFDPARRYESDLLGSVDPRLLAILGPATAAAVYGLGELYANQRRDEQTR